MSEGAIQEHPRMVEVEREAEAHQAHDRGLLAIGLFKLAKSAFFFAAGIGAIDLLHKDLGDVAMRISQTLHFDPQGHFVDMLIAKVDVIDPLRLRQATFGSFAYSALAMIEGIGLMREKVWAEFLTLGLTISFLPWELYELARGFDLVKVTLLLGNLAILAYLVWLLRRKRKAVAQ